MPRGVAEQLRRSPQHPARVLRVNDVCDLRQGCRERRWRAVVQQLRDGRRSQLMQARPVRPVLDRDVLVAQPRQSVADLARVARVTARDQHRTKGVRWKAQP